MFVEFWDVGSATSAPLAMTVGDISSHLAADWVPSLPPADGTAFMGWPPFLIEDLPSYSNTTFLALRDGAARSERQLERRVVVDARRGGCAALPVPAGAAN
jgi:hypothetical protein